MLEVQPLHSRSDIRAYLDKSRVKVDESCIVSFKKTCSQTYDQVDAVRTNGRNQEFTCSEVVLEAVARGVVQEDLN